MFPGKEYLYKVAFGLNSAAKTTATSTVSQILEVQL